MHYYDGTPVELGDTFTRAPNVAADRFHALKPGESAIVSDRCEGADACNLTGAKLFAVAPGGYVRAPIALPGPLGKQVVVEISTITTTASECALMKRAGE